MDVARGFILGRVAAGAAQEWAAMLSYAIDADHIDGDGVVIPGAEVDHIAQSIDDGVVVHYRVYDPAGIVVFSPRTEEIGRRLLGGDTLTQIRSGRSVTRLGLAGLDGMPSASVAEVYLPITAAAGGTAVPADVAGSLSVRVDRQDMEILLDRYLLAGFLAIFAIFAFVGGGTLAVLHRHLRRQTSLENELERASHDLSLAETVAKVGHWSIDMDTHDMTWSPEMYRIFGQNPEFYDPRKNPAVNMIVPEDQPVYRSQVRRMIVEHAEVEFETRIRLSTGELRYILHRGGAERGQDGKVARLFGVSQDITLRKQAEEALAEREEVLDLAVRATRAAIWDWHIPTDTLKSTGRLAEILGEDPDTFVPRMGDHHKRCHPDDFPRVQEGFQNHFKNGDPYDAEYRIRRVDGTYIWIHSRGRIVSYENDQPGRMVGTIIEITDRREYQEKIKQSEETLQLALQAAEAGYFDRRWDTGEIHWSPSFREMLGIADPAFKPNPNSFFELVHEEDRPAIRSAVQSQRESARPLDMECRVRHASGKYIWIQLRANVFKDSEGNPTRTIGFAIDITAQREAEEAVIQSEKKFRDLIEGSLQGLVIHRKFEPLFANDAYAHLLGYVSADEILALPSLLDILPEYFSDKADDYWQQCLSGDLDGVVRRGQVKTRTGETVWTDTVGRLVEWDGEPAFQTAVVDVSQQQRALQALAESEERFRLVAENASDMITIRRTDGTLDYVSPSCLPITGYSSDEMLNLSAFEFIHPDDRQLLESIRDRWRESKTGIMEPLIWRLIRKDGKPIWLETTSSILPPSEKENMSRVLSLSRDVTERVEREQELESARDRLKQQADELGVLAQNLEIEREKADLANQYKSQFLATMSHELRTPMTGVLGMADLLSDTDLTVRQGELLNTLKRSAVALLDLLNDILDFSKIEAGELDLEIVDFRLSTMLDDVENLFGPMLSGKGLTLTLNRADGMEDVLRGDPTRIRQVLINLIGNAYKFTERGGITVDVSQARRSDDGLLLEIAVTDTGIGIAPKNQARLFQAFEQAEADTTRKFGGTGLGLAICKQLVEVMGGSIGVKSELGQGSTFSYSVAVERGDASNAVIMSPTTAPAMEAVEGQAYAILVAEDNATTRMLLSSMLERAGHTIVMAENGQLAVDQAAINNFDIILMDMQMPVMDGPDAIQAIRKSGNANARKPVIALTADAVKEHRKEYLAAGADVVVTKPVNWAVLFAEMNRLVETYRNGGNRKFADKPAVEKENKAAEAASVPAFTDQPVLDESYMQTLRETLSDDILSPMLVTCQENMRMYVNDLKTHVAADDLHKAKRSAHALKGLSAQFGASRVSVMAKFIEEKAAAVSDIESLLPHLAESVEEACAALES